MPTSFSEIFERAIFKFKDYGFLNMDNGVKDELLKNYLLSAISDFQHSCKVDLNDLDLDSKQFNSELNNEVVEILSLGIAYYWLSSQAMSNQLFKNRIHSADYKSYSPANLLKEIQSLKDIFEADYKGKIRTYSVRNSDIENRKT